MSNTSPIFERMPYEAQNCIFEIQALLLTLKKTIPKGGKLSSKRASAARIQVNIIQTKLEEFINVTNGVGIDIG